MALRTSMLRVRIDDDVRARAQEALAAMGLTMSDAVRLFLRRVAADQAFPFDVNVPNAVTQSAIGESRALMAARSGRFATAEQLFAELEKDCGE